jgi:hypothetical protein
MRVSSRLLALFMGVAGMISLLFRSTFFERAELARPGRLLNRRWLSIGLLGLVGLGPIVFAAIRPNQARLQQGIVLSALAFALSSVLGAVALVL